MSYLRGLKIHDSVVVSGKSNNKMGNFTSSGSTESDCNVKNAVFVDDASENQMHNFTNTSSLPVKSTRSGAPEVSSSTNKRKK